MRHCHGLSIAGSCFLLLGCSSGGNTVSESGNEGGAGVLVVRNGGTDSGSGNSSVGGEGNAGSGEAGLGGGAAATGGEGTPSGGALSSTGGLGIGGAFAGGALSTGGVSSTGGSSSSGGMLTTAGAMNVGGMAAGAGTMSTGGTVSTGGMPSAGGMVSSGGTPSAGGMTSSGGSSGSGGAPPACTVDLNCDPPDLPSTGDFAQDCVNRINQFRVGCHCLEPLIRWSEAEACADANAEWDQGTGVAHSGWWAGACPDASGPLSEDYYGWATNECPGWNSAGSIVSGCMASMYSEGAQWAAVLGREPTQADYDACDNGCYSQYGHFIAMTKQSHTHVACGIYDGGSNDIWSVQNFE